MSGGGSSARQASASRSQRTPSEVSQEECQPATEDAQSETGSVTGWSLRGRIPRIEEAARFVSRRNDMQDLRSDGTFMRRETPDNRHDCPGSYGAGTRVEVHRSRHELERVLQRYGAGEVLFVEADANASIQFELQGRCVQLALPLPDPQHARFTHTPTGKPRGAVAQERAYEQALREHWRSLVVAVRGKLQSVESGISTFEQEFDRFLVRHAPDPKQTGSRNRKTPKVVNWLLGGSHSLAIALVAAFLVPASAVGAFALPTNVVGNLAAPFRSAVSDESNAAAGAHGFVLARGGWVPTSANRSDAAAHFFALHSTPLAGTPDGELRETASLSSAPVEPFGPPSSAGDSESPSVDSPSPSTSTPDSGPAEGPKRPASESDPAAGGTAPPGSGDEPGPSTEPEQPGSDSPNGDDSPGPTGTKPAPRGAPPADQPEPPGDEPEAGTLPGDGAAVPDDLAPGDDANGDADAPPGNDPDHVLPGQEKKDDP